VGAGGRGRGGREECAAQGREAPSPGRGVPGHGAGAVFDEDYEEVAARLAGTFADWDGWEESWGGVPTSGGITQARQRLRPGPMAELFS
jgi:hypothetical protein